MQELKDLSRWLQSIDHHKKQSWLLGCGTFFGIVLIILAVLSIIKVVPFNEYVSKKYNLKIKYPAHWAVHENLGVEGGVVGFVSPKLNEIDAFLPNVNISYKDLSGNPMDLKKFTGTAIHQLTGTFGDWVRVVESKDTRLAGRPAHRFIYMGQLTDSGRAQLANEGIDVSEMIEPASPTQYMHIWALDGRHAYIITYGATKEQFDEHMGLVNKMLNSFEINVAQPQQ